MPHTISTPSQSVIITHWVRDAAEQLAEVGIASALLDAEIILAHTLRKSRTWLHAHSDEHISERLLEIANARIDLRLHRTPIAYIIGHKEFYSRIFKVTPAVLIPRPESEVLIDQLKALAPPTSHTLLDIGTGSGCLGITAKLELPWLDVTVSDISRHALTVAEQNARALSATVTTVRSDLLMQLPGRYDIIVANLPYVDSSWKRDPETDYEPAQALFAEDNGYAIIHRLIEQSPDHLTDHGLLILEADPVQHNRIISSAQSVGLTHLDSVDYVCILQKQ